MEYEITLQALPEQYAAVMHAKVPHSGIGEFLGRAFGQTIAALTEQGQQPAGMPFGRYLPEDGGFDIVAGFPCAAPITDAGEVVGMQLPQGQAASTMHVGSYESVAAAYQAIEDWFERHGYRPTGPPWEHYLDGPEVTEPRTVVVWPCELAHAA